MSESRQLTGYARAYQANLERVLRIARERGYRLNPEPGRVEKVLGGMTSNLLEFGKYYCPCKQSRPLDPEKDVVCPCSVLDDEIAAGGRCRCRLFFGPGE